MLWRGKLLAGQHFGEEELLSAGHPPTERRGVEAGPGGSLWSQRTAASRVLLVVSRRHLGPCHGMIYRNASSSLIAPCRCAPLLCHLLRRLGPPAPVSLGGSLDVGGLLTAEEGGREGILKWKDRSPASIRYRCVGLITSSHFPLFGQDTLINIYSIFLREAGDNAFDAGSKSILVITPGRAHSSRNEKQAT